MNKSIYIALFVCLTMSMGYAQSLSQTVMANSGETITGASNTLSFTAGETIIGNISSSSSLGQGFWLGAIVELTLSSEDFTFEVEATVYPNPVTDYLNLYFKDMAGEDFKAVVYDLNGKQVLHKELLKSSANELLNFSTFSSGVYLLKIEQSTTKKSKTFKIIKQ